MSEGPKQTRGQRRPSLSDALRAAKKVGLPLKNATQDENGKITLTFNGGEVGGTGSETENEWTKRLKDLGYGKS